MSRKTSQHGALNLYPSRFLDDAKEIMESASLLMEANEYDVDSAQVLDLANKYDERYCQKLALLLDNPGLEVFYPLIRLMLKHKLRIEQEAVELRS